MEKKTSSAKNTEWKTGASWIHGAREGDAKARHSNARLAELQIFADSRSTKHRWSTSSWLKLDATSEASAKAAHSLRARRGGLIVLDSAEDNAQVVALGSQARARLARYSQDDRDHAKARVRVA